MTKREAIRQHEQSQRLQALGFTESEANALRRISMTLRRWYELECGDGNAYASWAIERDEDTGIPYMTRYDHGPSNRVTRHRVPDREKGAIKRLDAIIHARNIRQPFAESPLLSYYLQTDPRGAALYIIRPGDVPEGCDVSAYYTRGICVY